MELYFSDDKFKGYVPESAFPAGKYEEYHALVGDAPCMIANDYNIDIETEDIEDNEVSNPLRFLAKNIQDYLIYLPVGASGGTLFEACDASIEIEHYPVECMDLTSGAISSKVTIKYVESGTSKEIKIWVFRLDNDKYLLTSVEYDGIRIRPKKEFVTEFYENLDDFEEVLLNRDSNPLYSATFLTPIEEETGNAEYREVYTWPSEHGWNPDLANAAYETYVARLIDLASYHDNYDSDNIWRAMTHEAIKNLDWTFTREHEEDVESFDKIQLAMNELGSSSKALRGLVSSLETANKAIVEGIENISASTEEVTAHSNQTFENNEENLAIAQDINNVIDELGNMAN